MGVPDPEKLAQHVKTEEDEVKEGKTKETNAESLEPDQDQSANGL